jgi:hypothetical protein
MRFVNYLAAALTGACFVTIFTVFLWIFFSGQKLLTAEGVPPTLLGWLLPLAATFGASLGLGLLLAHEIEHDLRVRANQAFADRCKLQFQDTIEEPNLPKRVQQTIGPVAAMQWSQRCWGKYGADEVEIIDAYYSTNEGEDRGSVSHHQTVFFWRTSGARFPSFVLHRRSRGSAILSALYGSTSIVTFDANAAGEEDRQTVADFNRHWLVLRAGPTADDDLAIRRLLVPRVMRAISAAGHPRVAVDEEGVAFWRPDQRCQGEQREQELVKLHGLWTTLNARGYAEKETVIPADAHCDLQADASWAVLPLGCAFALGSSGLFVGIALMFVLVVANEGRLSNWVFPVTIFGSIFALAGLGWLAGKWLERTCRKPAARSKAGRSVGSPYV